MYVALSLNSVLSFDVFTSITKSFLHVGLARGNADTEDDTEAFGSHFRREDMPICFKTFEPSVLLCPAKDNLKVFPLSPANVLVEK